METTWQKNWHSSEVYPTLIGDAGADVVIIGGGITGSTLAYLLAKEGKSVIVLEKGTLRESSYTAYTTAMITAQVDTNFSDLVKIFGKQKANDVWGAGLLAIDQMEAIIKEEKIDCEFQRVPVYVYGNDIKEWRAIEEEAKLTKKAGFHIEIPKDNTTLNIPNAGYYIFSGQAIFHPLKYCDSLRQAAVKMGAKFYENSEVINIEGRTPVTVFTKDAKVKAQYVVVATYYPFNKPRELFAKKGMYLSYMYELSIPRGTLPPGLYVDGANPYHYFRVDKVGDRDRVVIGGADHRKEIPINPEKNYAEILDYIHKIFGNTHYIVETKWNGAILEPVDGIPFIGNYSKEYPNRLIATCYSGNGLTYSMLAGKILTDYIMDRQNPYAHIFDPLRHIGLKAALIKARDYTVEFFNGYVKNVFRSVK